MKIWRVGGIALTLKPSTAKALRPEQRQHDQSTDKREEFLEYSQKHETNMKSGIFKG